MKLSFWPINVHADDEYRDSARARVRVVRERVYVSVAPSRPTRFPLHARADDVRHENADDHVPCVRGDVGVRGAP